MFKDIEHFLHVTAGFTIVVTDYAFGDYVALLFKEDAASGLAATMSDFNADGEIELWGLGLGDWFPVGFGTSISDALVALNRRLKATEPDWDAMIPIMEHLANGQMPGYQVSCPIRNLVDVRDYNQRWNHGQEDLPFLVGAGVKDAT